jgi:S1-C subfamily serine protease
MKGKLLPVVSVIIILLLALAGSASAQDNGRPFLGINIGEHDDGALVINVQAGSAADDAGLMVDDVITAINGEAVTADTIAGVIQSSAVGDVITLDILRDGEAMQLDATLTDRMTEPAQPNRPFRPQIQARVRGAFLGVQLEDSDNGVTITNVVADSPAEDAGFEADDVITAIDGEEVSTVREAIEAVQAKDSGDNITVSVERDSDPMDIDVTLGEFPIRLNETLNFGGDDIDYLEDEGVWEIHALGENSALADAGLQAGDKITAINGESFESNDLFGLLDGFDPSEDMTLTVERDGETLDVDVPGYAALALAPFLPFRFGQDGIPVQPYGDGREGVVPFDGGRFGFGPGGSRGPNGFNFNFGNRIFLGITYRVIDAQVAESEGLDVTDGALVTEVVAGSPAESSGLLVGDIITAVSGDVVDFERTLSDRLYAYEAGDTVTLDILRDGETIQIDVTLGQPEQRSDVAPVAPPPNA